MHFLNVMSYICNNNFDIVNYHLLILFSFSKTVRYRPRVFFPLRRKWFSRVELYSDKCDKLWKIKFRNVTKFCKVFKSGKLKMGVFYVCFLCKCHIFVDTNEISEIFIFKVFRGLLSHFRNITSYILQNLAILFRKASHVSKFRETSLSDLHARRSEKNSFCRELLCSKLKDVYSLNQSHLYLTLPTPWKKLLQVNLGM